MSKHRRRAAGDVGGDSLLPGRSSGGSRERARLLGVPQRCCVWLALASIAGSMAYLLLTLVMYPNQPAALMWSQPSDWLPLRSNISYALIAPSIQRAIEPTNE